MQTKGRVAVVTGAGSGIGRAVAELMLDSGWNVVLAGRRAELLDEVAAQREGALVVPTDVTDVGQVDRLFERAVQHWGRVDVLFNNAGVPGPAASAAQIDPADLSLIHI